MEKQLKKYKIIYGNNAWEEEIITLSTSKQKVRNEIQNELRKGVSILKIIEL